MEYRLWSCITVLCFLNFILEATDGLSVPNPTKRACVIGAGYTGLGTARYMQQYGVNFTVFEATKHFGGTWRFDPHVGTDEDGLPLFTHMYKNLRTNTPRQTMEYAGFTFPEGTPSYPTGTCFYKYLKSFAKNFDLVKNIQFQSLITSVKWAGDHWNLTYTKVDTGDNHTETCDFVAIAIGQYNKPVLPYFEGKESFKGRIIHSHDYRDPEDYRNRRVLIVGAGASGLDLAIHLSNVTAKLVHSHHLVYNQPNFPKTYIKKPDIKAFTSDGVVFQDGTFEEVDIVIFCTGFSYSFPFVDENAGVTTSDKFVLPLYRHIVNIKRPTMAFVGIAKGSATRLYQTQAHYAAALAAGKFKLPSQEDMLRSWLDHVYTLQEKYMKIVDVNVVGNAMDHYFANLTEEAGVIRVPPVLSEIRDFNAKNRLEDLLNYRDYDYKVIDDQHYERWYNPREDHPCPIED